MEGIVWGIQKAVGTERTSASRSIAEDSGIVLTLRGGPNAGKGQFLVGCHPNANGNRATSKSCFQLRQDGKQIPH